MNLEITFPIFSFPNTGVALEFISKYLNFNIEVIIPRGTENYLSWDDNVIDELKLSNPEGFSIVDEFRSDHCEKNRLIFRRDIFKKAELFSMTIEQRNSIHLDALLLNAIKHNLSTAYLYDFHKSYWQSEIFVLNYETAKRDYQHLSIIHDPSLPLALAKTIDIKKNPGHKDLTYEMGLIAAPEMWFGPNSFKHFNKNTLLSYPNAKKITQINEDLIYIHLFDYEEDDYESQEILNLQRDFRFFVGMDAIEKKLDDLLAEEKKRGLIK